MTWMENYNDCKFYVTYRASNNDPVLFPRLNPMVRGTVSWSKQKWCSIFGHDFVDEVCNRCYYIDI